MECRQQGFAEEFSRHFVEWKCLLDLIKSRLTGASQASDIVVWMVGLMIGLHTGKVYNWAMRLLECIWEFMCLKHKAFYMTPHTIGQLLDSIFNQVPLDNWGKF